MDLPRTEPPQPRETPPGSAGRALSVRGFRNLRDLGGLPRTGGSPVIPGRLLRSDFPDTDSPLGSELRTISQVIDLRGAEEVMEAPSPFPGLGIPVVQVPLFAGSAASFVAQRVTLSTMYQHLLGEAGTSFAMVAGAVETAPAGAVLIHCTAGKDRTGLAVALILEAVGVDRAAVVADYALTEQNLGPNWLADRIAVLQPHHQIDLREVAELLAGSPAVALRQSLEYLDAEWGSAAGYLAAHGFGEASRRRLEFRLTEARL